MRRSPGRRASQALETLPTSLAFGRSTIPKMSSAPSPAIATRERSGLRAGQDRDDHGDDREGREHRERIVVAVRRRQVAQRIAAGRRSRPPAGRWSSTRTRPGPRRRPRTPSGSSRSRPTDARATLAGRAHVATPLRVGAPGRGASAPTAPARGERPRRRARRVSRSARSWTREQGARHDQGRPGEQLDPEAAEQSRLGPLVRDPGGALAQALRGVDREADRDHRRAQEDQQPGQAPVPDHRQPDHEQPPRSRSRAPRRRGRTEGERSIDLRRRRAASRRWRTRARPPRPRGSRRTARRRALTTAASATTARPRAGVSSRSAIRSAPRSGAKDRRHRAD